jgi:hypothetical protein
VHSSEHTCSGHSFTASELAWFFHVHASGDTNVACLFSVGELALFFMCILLAILMWLVLFQRVSWPGFSCALFW